MPAPEAYADCELRTARLLVCAELKTVDEEESGGDEDVVFGCCDAQARIVFHF